MKQIAMKVKKHMTKQAIERLRSRFFGIFREPGTSRSHVTSALTSGLQFEVHVFTARPRSRFKWFTARLFAPQSAGHNLTFERKYYI